VAILNIYYMQYTGFYADFRTNGVR